VGGGKKLYTITPEGLAFLAENKAAVDGVMARMDLAAQAFTNHSTPDSVREAFHTLRHSLHMRQGPWTEEEAINRAILIGIRNRAPQGKPRAPRAMQTFHSYRDIRVMR